MPTRRALLASGAALAAATSARGQSLLLMDVGNNGLSFGPPTSFKALGTSLVGFGIGINTVGAPAQYISTASWGAGICSMFLSAINNPCYFTMNWNGGVTSQTSLAQLDRYSVASAAVSGNPANALTLNGADVKFSVNMSGEIDTLSMPANLVYFAPFHNDYALGSTYFTDPSVTMATVNTMINAFRAKGVTLVVCTDTPQGPTTTTMEAHLSLAGATTVTASVSPTSSFLDAADWSSPTVGMIGNIAGVITPMTKVGSVGAVNQYSCNNATGVYTFTGSGSGGPSDVWITYSSQAIAVLSAPVKQYLAQLRDWALDATAAYTFNFNGTGNKTVPGMLYGRPEIVVTNTYVLANAGSDTIKSGYAADGIHPTPDAQYIYSAQAATDYASKYPGAVSIIGKPTGVNYQLAIGNGAAVHFGSTNIGGHLTGAGLGLITLPPSVISGLGAGTVSSIRFAFPTSAVQGIGPTVVTVSDIDGTYGRLGGTLGTNVDTSKNDAGASSTLGNRIKYSTGEWDLYLSTFVPSAQNLYVERDPGNYINNTYFECNGDGNAIPAAITSGLSTLPRSMSISTDASTGVVTMSQGTATSGHPMLVFELDGVTGSNVTINGQTSTFLNRVQCPGDSVYMALRRNIKPGTRTGKLYGLTGVMCKITSTLSGTPLVKSGVMGAVTSIGATAGDGSTTKSLTDLCLGGGSVITHEQMTELVPMTGLGGATTLNGQSIQIQIQWLTNKPVSARVELEWWVMRSVQGGPYY